MSVTKIRVGDVELTRVGYAEIGVEPAAVGLTPEQVASVSWAGPPWTDGPQVRAAAAAWVISSGDATIVVDPAQAVDDILRSDTDAAAHQEAFAQQLAAAGFPRERVTHAIATHLDGIGMFAWRNDDGSWVPFFPNAPILMSQRELERVDTLRPPAPGTEALAALRALGAVQVVTGAVERITEHVTIEFTGGHSTGHQIVRVESKGDRAAMLGHLAVSPFHVAMEQCPAFHEEPEPARSWLETLRSEGSVLVGPLWPEPGAGRWESGRLVPAGRPD